MPDETDLVKIAERNVLEKGHLWLKLWRTLGTTSGTEWELLRKACSDAQAETLGALVLLEERERQQEQLYDPDHLNPGEGGNRAANDYW